MEGPSSAPELIGRTIGGRYRVERVLDEGGIAVVFCAEHVGVGRSVALKVLHSAYGEHEELRGRFAREAKALASVSHPHIVGLVDYGVDDDMPYLVMELLEGQTVRQLLDAEGPLPPTRAFGILRQVLRTLSFAHGKGLLHRDLKPANIFLQHLPDDPDHVKVLDFGFAKFVAGDQAEEGPALTRAGTVFGTPSYMAPEQITGGAIDARADLYATGALLYEMLTASKPFHGEIPEMIRQKVAGAPPSLQAARPEVTVVPELEVFVTRAFGPQDTRFESAEAMLASLDAIPTPAFLPRGSVVPAATTGPPGGVRSRSFLPWLGLAGAMFLGLLVCAGGLTWWLTREGDPPASAEPVAMPAPDDPQIAVEGLSVVDPWTVGEVPPLYEAVRAQLEAGEEIDQDTLVVLRDRARSTPDDGRPWLLMAHAFAQRGWKSDALARYAQAHSVNPGVRGDPRMLANLVAMSANPAVGDQAARLVARIYGPEALPTIEAALQSPHLPRAGANRLRRLRQSL